MSVLPLPSFRVNDYQALFLEGQKAKDFLLALLPLTTDEAFKQNIVRAAYSVEGVFRKRLEKSNRLKI